MKILTFAHRAEAQEFLDHHEAQIEIETGSSKIYSCKIPSLIIAITGEGVENALFSSTQSFGFAQKKSPNEPVEFINIGICGALSKEISLDKIVTIKGSYLFREKVEFHSFQSTNQDSPYNCISCSERVNSLKKAQALLPIADLVDRELWGVAYVAKKTNSPFKSVKYISDYAYENKNCLEIKKNAHIYSEKLLKHCLEKPENLPSEKKQIELHAFSDPYFHFTHSQKDLYKKKLHSLKKIYNDDEETLIFNFKRRNKKSASKKQNASDIIQYLSTKLAPHKYEIYSKIEQQCRSLKKSKIKYNFDQNLEEVYLDISKRISSEKDLEELKTSINSFSYTQFKESFS